MTDYKRFRVEYLCKLRYIDWEAAQWMQYVGYDWDHEGNNDDLVLHFKTSSYGIGFSIRMKAFSSLYGEPRLDFNEVYNYFKDVKYGQYKPYEEGQTF